MRIIVTLLGFLASLACLGYFVLTLESLKKSREDLETKISNYKVVFGKKAGAPDAKASDLALASAERIAIEDALPEHRNRSLGLLLYGSGGALGMLAVFILVPKRRGKTAALVFLVAALAPVVFLQNFFREELDTLKSGFDFEKHKTLVFIAAPLALLLFCGLLSLLIGKAPAKKSPKKKARDDDYDDEDDFDDE